VFGRIAHESARPRQVGRPYQRSEPQSQSGFWQAERIPKPAPLVALLKRMGSRSVIDRTSRMAVDIGTDVTFGHTAGARLVPEISSWIDHTCCPMRWLLWRKRDIHPGR